MIGLYLSAGLMRASVGTALRNVKTFCKLVGTSLAAVRIAKLKLYSITNGTDEFLSVPLIYLC